MSLISTPEHAYRETLSFSAVEELLAAIPAGVLVINAKGQVDYFNQGAKDIFDSLKKQEPWDEVLKRNLSNIGGTGIYVGLKSGKHIQLKTQALPNMKGQLILILDETLQKKMNEHELKLEKLDSVGKLSASLAHQLRTPLSTAFLYVSNLTEKLSKTELKFYQDKIKKQLLAIKQQIEDVLLVCKGEKNIIEKIDALHEIKAIISNYKELYPQTIINLHYSQANGYHVLANPQSLKGALTNIIDNAIQASIKLSPKVDIQIKAENNKVMIEVKDYGEGICEQHIKKVFDPFFTTKKNGTGLGLAIAKNVIESHLGSLTITSIKNESTTLTIELPIYEESRV